MPLKTIGPSKGGDVSLQYYVLSLHQPIVYSTGTKSYIWNPIKRKTRYHLDSESYVDFYRKITAMFDGGFTKTNKKCVIHGGVCDTGIIVVLWTISLQCLPTVCRVLSLVAFDNVCNRLIKTKIGVYTFLCPTF